MKIVGKIHKIENSFKDLRNAKAEKKGKMRNKTEHVQPPESCTRPTTCEMSHDTRFNDKQVAGKPSKSVDIEMGIHISCPADNKSCKTLKVKTSQAFQKDCKP